MSSLHDPFDLIETGQKMDNLVPFLPANKVSLMVDKALAHPQISVRKTETSKYWRFGGLAIAACLALFMVFLTPESLPVTHKIDQKSISAAVTEDVGEFGELVMLDTLERY